MDPIPVLEEKFSPLKVDGFEIYYLRSHQLSIEAKEGEVESCQEAISQGVAVQLFHQGRIGFASTSEVSEPLLERVVTLAYNTLTLIEEAVPFALPEGRVVPPWSGGHDATLARRPVGEKAALAILLEQEARRVDPRVTRVRGARYEEREETITLKTSRGFNGRYTKTLCELSLMAVAEEKGCQEMAWESEFSPKFSELTAAPGRRAAERALSLLGAKPISTRKAPAILDPQVGASLLSVLSASLLGDQVVRGKSVLKDRVGEEVYAKNVNLVDDGCRPGGFATAPFDGEGMPTQRTDLVAAGRLQGFLHDRASAAKMKAASTGNGMRPVYKERPRVGASNFFMEPGTLPLEQIIRELGCGFWILDLIGVHTADPVTGDFSLGACGFWMEKGTKVPVRGVAVSGNLHELFKKVVSVGSEIRFYHGYGCPPLLISEIDIGGV